MKKWIKKLRIFIGSYFLQKGYEKTNRKITVYNLNQANTIGIIYQVKNEETYYSIKDYVKWLKEQGIKQIKALGYVDDKIIPVYLHPHISFDFFCNKDINWHMQPFGNNIANFVTADFDILIDLSEQKCFPLKFLLSKSRAKFKVGTYSKKYEKLYDLMIDVKEKKKFNFLLEQITHYLTIINKKENEPSV